MSRTRRRTGIPGGGPAVYSKAERSRGSRLGSGFAIAAFLVMAVGIIGISRIDDLGDTLQEVTLPLRHENIIRQQAAEKGVDADLIAAVIYTESRFRDQTSSAGARGLMQITPDTADVIENLSGGETFVTEDLANPDINIRYGTFYLAYLLDKYGGNQTAALAAYNAGEGNADAWGGSSLTLKDIRFPETQAYVAEVRDKRRDYREKYREELGLAR